MTSALQASLNVAGAARPGRRAYWPADTYLITRTLNCFSYSRIEGEYGETTLGGGGLVDSGTKLLWGGPSNSVMLRVYDCRLIKLEGLVLDANSVPGVTCILLDSNNAPSGSQNEFHRFSLRNFAVGFQWGTSGIAGGSYANDGTRLSTFTMWSQVSGSVGIEIDSGNAGQMSTIESGGIQVDNIGIDIQVANLVQIRRVFGGWALKTAFIRVSVAIDVLIEGCSSEGWGSSGSQRASDSNFLQVIPPVETYPMIQSTITMMQNQINNPIVVNSVCRIVSTGDAWGYCLSAADHVTWIPATGTFNASSTPSRLIFLNNGVAPATINLTTNEPAMGWIDGPYVDMTNLDPGRGWVSPAFNPTSFSAISPLLWTVSGSNVETYAYTLVNRTMTVAFKINSATLASTAGPVIMIEIPNGKVASLDIETLVMAADTARRTAIAYVTAGSSWISFQPSDLSNWNLCTNAMSLHGQITFEVN
jgi:hypothetical protein